MICVECGFEAKAYKYYKKCKNDNCKMYNRPIEFLGAMVTVARLQTSEIFYRVEPIKERVT